MGGKIPFAGWLTDSQVNDLEQARGRELTAVERQEMEARMRDQALTQIAKNAITPSIFDTIQLGTSVKPKMWRMEFDPPLTVAEYEEITQMLWKLQAARADEA